MLEALVAIGVILTAIIGSSTLIISSITAGRVSQNRVEAANFAREGIEIVRSIRDSNWLKFQQNEKIGATIPAWNTGLGNPAVNSTLPRILNYTLNQWILIPCGIGPTCIASATGVYRVVDSSTNRIWYSQYNSVAACGTLSCTRTKYNRIINLTLKEEIINDGDADATDDTFQYLLVESIVTWPDRTGTKTLTAVARLYDWK